MNNLFSKENLENAIMSKKEMARKLSGKQVEFIFVEEDDYNIVGFEFDSHIYIFDRNVK